MDISGYTVNASDSILRVHIGEFFDDPIDFINNWPDIVADISDLFVKRSDFRSSDWFFDWLIDNDIRHARDYDDRFSTIKTSTFCGAENVNLRNLLLYSKHFAVRIGNGYIVRRGRNLWIGVDYVYARNTLTF